MPGLDVAKTNLFYSWGGVGLLVAHAYKNTEHVHFSALLQIGVNTKVVVQLGSGEVVQGELVVVGPNVPHKTNAENGALIDVAIDPDDDLYRYLHPLLEGAPARSLPISRLKSLHNDLAELAAGKMSKCQAWTTITRSMQFACPTPLAELPWDPRIIKACAFMRDQLPLATPAVSEVAQEVGLSESRLMHLFKQNLGLPIRRYLLWLRLRYATFMWSEGRPLSEIAIESGFSDQAHFSRTLRQMTDFVPSIIKSDASAIID